MESVVDGGADRLVALARRGTVPGDETSGVLRAVAAEAGLERVRVLAWRDLDDPEAGGSERHAHRVASLWARAGLEVALRTSAVGRRSSMVTRDGYRVVRRSGRYAVFARAAAEGLSHPARPGEAMVEIWNGMPFWSPLWFRGPKVVFLHHVHAEMWGMTLPAWMARTGEVAERWMAPPVYRTTRVVTLSRSARAEIVERLGLRPDRVSVVPPGVEPKFSPGLGRSSTPLVVAVGRLAPVKRFDLLIRALVKVREALPDVRAVIVGEGQERRRLEALRHEVGADDWLSLPGRVDDDALVGWYRRAWVVASASLREGWGMTLTEAGACATAVVASDIAGHRDAVVDGRTGLLARGEAGLAVAIDRVLRDDDLRARLGRQGLARARRLTWDRTARGILEALAEEVYWAPGRRDASPRAVAQRATARQAVAQRVGRRGAAS